MKIAESPCRRGPVGLEQPEETVIPEVMVFPMRETSWP
jgi:hypothetical protein